MGLWTRGFRDTPRQHGRVNRQRKKEEGLVVGKARQHDLRHTTLVLACHGTSRVGLWAGTSTVRRRWWL